MPDHERIDQDPLSAAEAARAEDLLLVKRKARIYGRLALVNLAAFVLVLKGMPMHALWPVLGPAFGISLVCISATAGRYFVMQLSDSLNSQSTKPR